MSFTNLPWVNGPLMVSLLAVSAIFACSAQDGESDGGLGTGGVFASGGGFATGGDVGSGGDAGGLDPIVGPVTMGYILDVDRWGGVLAFDSLNFAATDYVIHAFYTGNQGTGLLEPVDASVTEYREGGLVDKVHAAGKRIVMSLGGANHSASLKTIAANPSLRATFVSDVVSKINEWGYDGVDLDFEFPSGGSEPQDHLALMTELYNSIKANNPEHVAMFGISPGWYVDQFLWAQLAAVSDYGFYFCYDWSMPANGPMKNPGSSFTASGGAQFEASCSGAMNYIIGQGYPAAQLVVGMPFYSTSWALWADAPEAIKSGAPDPNYMEYFDGSAYWTNVPSLQMKMDAVLTPSSSVLSGGATAAGIGWWEWGYENPAAPELSEAIRVKLGK